MADENEDDLIEDEVIDEPEQEEVAAEEEDGGDVITVEGDEPESEDEKLPEEAPKWVKETRVVNRELKKKVRELEAKLAQPAPQAPAVPTKPKLEDFDYNSDKYDEAMIEWTRKKLKADDAQEQAKKAQEQAEAEWKAKLDGYETSKKTLRVKDFEDAEDTVKELFSVTQQGIIVNGADLPAELVYVIGRNPKRAKELADIKDPAKFAFAVAKLEAKMKVERKDVPAPERRVVTGGVPQTASNLDRLKKEAVETGDWDKYFAAKRKAGK